MLHAFLPNISLLVLLLSVSRSAWAGPLESRDKTSLEPIVVPASQNFEGNDGPWSSFTLRIGSPAQVVTVFISTAAHQTLAVTPLGCIASDPINCAQTRGGLFNPNKSTTWTPNTSSTGNTSTYTLELETNLGYSGTAQYGFDSVALGWQGSGGPILDRQIVGGIATKDFYHGIFGLSPRPTNFTTFENPTASYLSNLKNRSLIPSLSWAYTAGNQYRLNKVLGSLTLGGYDASRFIPNELTIPFNQQDDKDLTVNIHAIYASSEGGTQRTDLLNKSISAFVDSTLPYIYMPLNVCQQFEAVFGITWNETIQAYLVNDTLHDSLVSQNTSVIFTLSNSTTRDGSTVEITLPYAAFDLVAEPPLADSRYFPLVRATNKSQYTLGRTFFQEAYVIADYERRNFSISQCSWVDNAPQQIVTISAPTNEKGSKADTELGPGAVGGMAVGCVAATCALALAIYYWIVRLRRGKGGSAELGIVDKPQEIDGKQHLGTEVERKGHRESELDSTACLRQELEGKVRVGSEMEGSHAFAQELGSKDPLASELPA
ncbi:MAG: hypothetical protein Q9213_005089 [Squamulea squamosa]